jgi:hypothetical protein
MHGFFFLTFVIITIPDSFLVVVVLAGSSSDSATIFSIVPVIIAV